jgi:hypothetical protein
MVRLGSAVDSQIGNSPKDATLGNSLREFLHSGRNTRESSPKPAWIFPNAHRKDRIMILGPQKERQHSDTETA